MNKPDSAGQYKCLVKHFFRRFFDFEAISSPQIDPIEKNALTFQILALLVMPGVLYCMFLFSKYGRLMYRPTIERDLATLTDKCFFLSLSMILLGFIAVFEWDMLFPDRKDYLILTPFPVSARTLFLAKIAALAGFLLTFTVAMDLVPTVFFPNIVLANNGIAYRLLGKRVPTSLMIRYVLSHGISVILGNILVFLSAISLQGVLLVLSPPKIAPVISRCIRFFCLLLLLCALFSFLDVSSVDQLIHQARPITVFYPPIWFVGLYEVLLGSREPAMRILAERAITGLAFAGALSVLSYAICYRRFMRRSFESGGDVVQNYAGLRAACNSMLDRWLIRKSENRASFHFVGQTLCRSPRHVLYIGTFFIVGCSIAAMELRTAIFSGHPSIAGHFDHALVSIPLILSFFLLVGARVSFAIPVDLDANWLFRLAPIRRIKENHAGLRKFLIGALIIPLFVLAGFSYALIWNWKIVLLHVGYGLLLSLILMELLFSRFPKIPFTCSYLPGAAQIVILWPFYVLGFRYFGHSAADLEIWLMGDLHRFEYFFALAALLLLMLIWRNIQSAGAAIRFEEQSDKAPIYLDLKS